MNIHQTERFKYTLQMQEKTTTVSSELMLREDPTDRVIDICKVLGVDTYLAGGADYVDVIRFAENGLEVIMQEFTHPVYPQLFKDLRSHLSVVALLNCGSDRMNVIRGANAGSP